MYRLILLLFLSVAVVKADDDDDDDDGDKHGSRGSSLFSKYDTNPHDSQLSHSEFHHFVMDFDTWPYDGVVSQHEFEAGWAASNSDLKNDGSAPLYFIRTDLDHDNQITSSDSEKLYQLFDENGNHFVSKTEFCDAFSAMYYALSHC